MSPLGVAAPPLFWRVSMNESKKIETTVHNGRTVVVGGVWKWGPGFAKSQ